MMPLSLRTIDVCAGLVVGPIPRCLRNDGLVIYGTYTMLFSTGAALRGYAHFSRWSAAIWGTYEAPSKHTRRAL